ncbi:MAG: NINE protein [Alistipes sp.]|nr:NINE protein [Alistipes sp.]
MALIYCKECGHQISEMARVCPHCGYNPSYDDPNRSNKDWLTAFLLCFFLGTLGVHSFYANKTAAGVIQLLTLGGCGIWALIDLIMIGVGSYRDGEGKYIKNV